MFGLALCDGIAWMNDISLYFSSLVCISWYSLYRFSKLSAYLRMASLSSQRRD